MAGTGSSEYDTEVAELSLALEEINTGSHRVCAIVGVALLEESLEHAIRKRLGQLERLYRNDEDEENRDYISEISKALKVNNFIGSIDPKIRMAYFLGIIGKEAKDNLLAISSIRHQFAHRKHVRDFDDERLKQLFKNITAHQRMPASIRLAIRERARFVPLAQNATRRERFTRAVQVLMLSIRFRSFTIEDSVVMHDPPDFCKRSATTTLR